MEGNRSIKWIYLLGVMVWMMAFQVCPASATAQPSLMSEVGDQFPLRAFYPGAKIINTDTLIQLYDKAIIIDVRSQFEFDVVRINKALHVDLSQGDFSGALALLCSPTADIPLIFYCNDPSCSRAFRAALLAQAAGYSHVYTYDSGVFALLKQLPQYVTLMETTPAQVARVISTELYEKSQLDFVDFKKQSTGRSALVIDIRDIFRRERLPAIKNIRNIPMEALLQAITNRIWTEKKLLIFDHHGDQTQSLQYFLQANGYKDYAFLRGGVGSLANDVTRVNQQQENDPVSINQKFLLGLIVDPQLQPCDIELITLVIAKIGFANHSVLNRHWAQQNLPYSLQELQQAAARLQRSGYLLFDENRSSLVFHINPILAWKGKMSGVLWSNSVTEFKTSIDNR